MPNRTTSHETDKLDHSTHPTSHATKDDLRAPGGADTGDKPDENAVDKPKSPKKSGADH